MNDPSTKALEDLCGKDALVKLFCEYVRMPSASDPLSKNVPSSVGQLRLGAVITAALRNLGYDAKQDENGVVTAHVEASEGARQAPALALIAHLDTAPDASGDNVMPELVKNYQGGDIKLKSGLILNEEICPELCKHVGDDIIVTAGDTLLGADDKAGVAVIMKLLYDLAMDPKIPHPHLCAVFSVDEEIGYGADHIDLDKVNCAYGVTIDGNEIGEFSEETFNAESAAVEITGRSVHTGTAYKVMKNAVELSARFIAMLPPDEKPQNTREREGFYHVHTLAGRTEKATLGINLRDFDAEGLKARITRLQAIAALINSECGYEAVKIKFEHQYSNMISVLKAQPAISVLCERAFAKAKVPLRRVSVRGGTDGSNLSVRGLPCPNIFTGALNCHGPYECLPVRSLLLSYDVVRALVEEAALIKAESAK